MSTLLHFGDPARGALWAAQIPQRIGDIEVRQWPDVGAPEEVRYLAAWTLPDGAIDQFPDLAFVLSVGAGTDQMNLGAIPRHVPVLRMAEPGIVDGMVEYAVLHTLLLHRDVLAYRDAQAATRWEPRKRRKASDRRVGIMGAGMLGRAVIDALQAFGFRLSTWSRNAKQIENVTCYAGEDGLRDFLQESEILICLLPLTAATENILDRDLFAALPRGAAVINVGRGRHLVEEDLLAALDSGQVSAAILDVTDPEPLPDSSRLWTHPRVILTPHVASSTDSLAAIDLVVEAIEEDRSGRPFRHAIDRSTGY